MRNIRARLWSVSIRRLVVWKKLLDFLFVNEFVSCPRSGLKFRLGRFKLLSPQKQERSEFWYLADYRYPKCWTSGPVRTSDLYMSKLKQLWCSARGFNISVIYQPQWPHLVQILIYNSKSSYALGGLKCLEHPSCRKCRCHFTTNVRARVWKLGFTRCQQMLCSVLNPCESLALWLLITFPCWLWNAGLRSGLSFQHRRRTYSIGLLARFTSNGGSSRPN